MQYKKELFKFETVSEWDTDMMINMFQRFNTI